MPSLLHALQEPPQSEFRQLTRYVCICVLLLGIYDAFVGTPPASIFRIHPDARLILFCVLISGLLALDRFIPTGRLEPADSGQSRGSIGYLLGILSIAGAAVSLWDYEYTIFLFAIAILYASLYFNLWVSLFAVLTSFGFLFVRLAYGPRGDFISSRDMDALLTFGLIVLMVIFISRLIQREARQRRDLQKLNGELARSHLQLQENADQLAELAILNERNRLARDIHDGLGHHLTAVGIQLEIAAQLQKSDPDASLGAIAEAKQAAKDALTDVRRSVHSLRHADEPFELKAAVDLLIKRIENENLSVSFKMEGEETRCPQPLRLTLFRAIQEGLTNVYKHAAASRVNLWLQFAAQEIRLRIIDDGTGFDPSQPAAGTGLKGIAERIESLGGTLAIDSRLNEGTVIDILIPTRSVNL
ncbi:MAG: sensor histidine kinase [Chloroflexota bacterium]